MSNSNHEGAGRDLINQIEAGWNELLSYLDSLSEEQLTQLTDAAGWTVKDHMIHLAMWETAALGLLEGKSKREVLNITPEIWEQDDDPINAVLHQRYQDLPLDQVMQTLQDNHGALLNKFRTMTDEDFLRPYSYYQPTSDQERPIIDWIRWDTVNHYDEHLTWIKEIARNQ